MRRSSGQDQTETEEEPKSQWRRWLRRCVIMCGILGVISLVVGSIGLIVAYHSLTADLPNINELGQYQPSLVTKVYDRNGSLIADFFIERRFLVSLDQIPLHVRQATIAVEDSRFYSHRGVDPIGVLRALWVNFRAGEVREGASTITQQVARTLFLTRERTFTRKLREAVLAHRIEQRFSKDQILEIYLNQIFYGLNAYGLEAASQLYFGKSVHELTLSEGALLSGLPQAPNRYSPLKDLRLSKQRRQHVLRRMVEEGYITAGQASLAQQESIHLNPHYKQVNEAPYFVEYVRRYLEERFGATRLYRGGFEVYTTLDLRLQQVAQQALRHGILAADKRHGYQRPQQQVPLTGDSSIDAPRLAEVTMPEDGDTTVREGDVLPAVVLEVRNHEVVVALKASRGLLRREAFAWVRKPDLQVDFLSRRVLEPQDVFAPGDVIQVRVTQVDPAGKAHHLYLEQEPVVEGALFAMDVGTGHVLAMVGGYDFARSQFNRAMQAMRQPGSAFKPVIYATAMKAGMTPASIIIDAPVVKENTTDHEYWKPENYSQQFYGPTTLRTALTHSRNLVTVRLLDKIGVPAVLDSAKQLGIVSPLAPYLSLALGSSDVTLAELTTAYGVFANGGMYVPPMFISKIVDAQGTIVDQQFPAARRALSPEIAYVMTSLLESVITNGTGRNVHIIGRPAAGKTGTTNDFRDAWFIGYTPEVITGVWVGMDDRTSLGQRETGGRVASPIWLEFMQAAMRGRPITNFAIPPGVRFVRIEADSGVPATTSGQPDTMFEVFVDGTQPKTVVQPVSDVRRDIRRLDRRRLATPQPTSG